jgi:hypothetical protein
MRKLLFYYSLYSHPEIGNFRVWQPSTGPRTTHGPQSPPWWVHWQHTHLVIREKEKIKETNKKKLQQVIESREKAKSKITWRRQVSDPLGKGNDSTHPRQNHALEKSTNHQSIQELPLHICKLPLNKCQLWAQTGQAGSQYRSDRFRTVDHTPKSQKMQNKCTSSLLTLGIGSRDAMQLFSTFLSPPCCQCTNQGSSLKTCNLELLKYTKFITICYTCPNEQVRYSTTS